MKKLHILTLLISLLLSALALADTKTPFPTTPPEQAAQEAFHAGSREYLKATTCVSLAPISRASKRIPIPARNLVSCKEFTEEWKATPMAKWEEYARRYNDAMFDLREQERRKKSGILNFP